VSIEMKNRRKKHGLTADGDTEAAFQILLSH
jgi:hypothetical protein